jgi:hypothetical protein
MRLKIQNKKSDIKKRGRFPAHKRIFCRPLHTGAHVSKRLSGSPKNQLRLTKQEKENLKEEARRQGIPPGYLRP